MDDPKVSDSHLKIGLQAILDSVEFVQKPQQCCPECEKALVFYHIGECEHKPILCSICYERKAANSCHICEWAIQDVCREKSQILDLDVYCPLKKDGCEAVLPLRNILIHQGECHPAVDLIKQVTQTRVKQLDSVESFKPQAKEDNAELKNSLKELQKKVGNNRTVEKLTNQLALLEEKVNREFAAKKEMEKRLMEQTKRKSDVVKQELLRHINEQLKQQVDKQVKKAEMNLERTKQEVVKAVTSQVSRQVERQIQESRRPKEIKLSRNQLMDSEKRIPKELPKNAVQQRASLQSVRKIHASTSSAVGKDKTITVAHRITAEFNKTDMTSNELDQKIQILNQEPEKICNQSTDCSDSQNHDTVELFKELVIKDGESHDRETQIEHKMYEDLCTRLESNVLQRVAQVAEKQTREMLKQCEVLVNEQIKKEMAEVKGYVTRSISAELGRHVAELQKMFAKELMAQKQQLEKANQQFVNQASESHKSSCNTLKTMVERDKDQLQKLMESKFNVLLRNQTTELNKKMVEELKTHKQDLVTANQKLASQLQEMNENAGKQLSKRNESDKDKILRAVDERVSQQSKVNETELQKRIAKELKLQKLELVQENQNFVTQLHDSQENALKQYGKKAEVEKEKWMKYAEERLNQQMKAYASALNNQMLQDMKVQKQELLQANQQLMNQLTASQETTAHRMGKKMETQKQGLLQDMKNQLWEQLEKQLNALHQSNPQPHVLLLQDDVIAVRNDLVHYIDSLMKDVQEQISADIQTKMNEKRPATDSVDGVAAATLVSEREELKRAIVSEIRSSLFDQFQDLKMTKYEKCFQLEVVANGQEDPVCGLNGNSDAGVDHVDRRMGSNDGQSAAVMSHFEHFEAMQRKIFNKQFGRIVSEANDKIMAVVNELSGPKEEELVASVTLRVSEQFSDMQKALFGHVDGQIQNHKREVTELLRERLGPCATETNGNGDFQEGARKEVGQIKDFSGGLLNGVEVQNERTTFMKEWHEENSKMIQLTNGNLPNNVDRQEEIRQLIKEELVGSNAPEESLSGVDDIVTTYIWRIPNFSKKLEGLKTKRLKQITSNEFTVQGTQLKLKAHLMITKLPYWASLVMGYVKPEGLEERARRSMFSHRRTFVLVDQSNVGRRRDRIIVREPGFRDEGVDKWMARFYGPLCFAPSEALEAGSSYVKNDTLIIKIILEPSHLLYKSVPNSDGVLFWKIDNYRLKKQAEVDGLVECLYSDYFSTSPKGYRMQIRAYLNGDDQCKSDHLSIYLYFRRGQYDEFITSSFPHKVTFTVLDQSEAGNRVDISKSMESDGHILSAYGLREFARQSEIEMPEYLKDDTLLLKVEVEPLAESEPEYKSRNNFLHG